MKRPPPVATALSVALRFKTEIEQAASQGATLDEMTLHLTLGDVERLKRDRTLPVADISFAGGTMSYLGVKILKGDVPLSILSRQVADGV